MTDTINDTTHDINHRYDAAWPKGDDMTQKDDGGQAYPLAATTESIDHYGMSLRDAAALAALQAIVSGYMSNPDMSGLSPQMIADEAFQHADAFIAARSGGET